MAGGARVDVKRYGGAKPDGAWRMSADRKISEQVEAYKQSGGDIGAGEINEKMASAAAVMKMTADISVSSATKM
jgi:hypothetical protein